MTAIVNLDDDPADEPDQRADEVERWAPDDQLLAVVMGSPHSPRKLTAMPDEDRCHLVAGLTLAGWSAKEIKHRCGASIRLIRFLRAEPLTRVCMWALDEVKKVDKQYREEKAARLTAESDLEQSRRRETRLQKQLDQILDQLKVGGKVQACRKGLHAMTEYNTYRYTDKSGNRREICRECNRDRVTKFHAKTRAAKAVTQEVNAAALQNLHPAIVVSAL